MERFPPITHPAWFLVCFVLGMVTLPVIIRLHKEVVGAGGGSGCPSPAKGEGGSRSAFGAKLREKVV